MSASEYLGWQKYLAIEPFGGENLQQALIAYTLSAVNGNKNAKLDDFIISMHTGKRRNEIPKAPSSDQIKSIFGAVAIRKN